MTSTASDSQLRYCGRVFTPEEMDQIRRLIAFGPTLNRAQRSRLDCADLGWIPLDVRRQDMSCRVAMLRMHREGLIIHPPPRKANGNGRIRPRVTASSEPGEPCTRPARALGELTFTIVRRGRSSRLWNELIERYHYLGYKPLPGAQMRYLVHAGDRIVAVSGFGAAAWKVAPRDRYIGWTLEQRKRNLHLVVNNARFLILPWITSRNLASMILSRMSKRLPDDWQDRYGYSPVLLETYVETDRFRGTCYKAANWLMVGQTQGRGKLDQHHLHRLPRKDILLYPLNRRFRERLLS